MRSAPSIPIAAPAKGLPADQKQIWRHHSLGMDVVRIGTTDSYEVDLTLHALPGENLEALLRRLDAQLREWKVTPVLQLVLGSLDSLKDGEACLRRVFGDEAWPVTWLEGAHTDGGLAGTQVFALSKREIQRVEMGGKVHAMVFDNGNARHCLLGGLGYGHPSLSRPDQTQHALEELDSLLRTSGFDFGDIARTWFYLQDILAWYNDFNQVRTRFYGKHKFRVGSLPASTGISAQNPWNSALSLTAWAVKPLNDTATPPVREVISPLQCPAACYGSSFSRAVEMDIPGGHRLLVSGTASIEPGGKTLWTGEIQKQISLTMEVVEAILQSRNMSIQDVSRASLYFKRPEFRTAFAEWAKLHGAKNLPGIPVHCDICREDLLFEIELDALA